MLLHKILNTVQQVVALWPKFGLMRAYRTEFPTSAAVSSEHERAIFRGEGWTRLCEPLPIRAIAGPLHVAILAWAMPILASGNVTGDRVLEYVQEAWTTVLLVRAEKVSERGAMRVRAERGLEKSGLSCVCCPKARAHVTPLAIFARAFPHPETNQQSVSVPKRVNPGRPIIHLRVGELFLIGDERIIYVRRGIAGGGYDTYVFAFRVADRSREYERDALNVSLRRDPSVFPKMRGAFGLRCNVFDSLRPA
jgi:hypothetical protein